MNELFFYICVLKTKESMPFVNRRKEGFTPEPALRRMPSYLAYLKMAQKQGLKHISSTSIARDMGIDPTQVTKDISHTKIAGKTRVGYEVDPLIEALEDFLYFKKMDKACLFGAGSLGTALLHDTGLKQFGLEIVAAYDVNENVIGKTIEGVPIHHIDRFYAGDFKDVEVGILTVPAENAQAVADKLFKTGIKAIWNFTPIRLIAPEDIVVQNTSLYAHLAVMFNRLHHR